MNDRLRDLMSELVGDPPVVADWSGQVRRAVVVRRRRQQVLTAAAAVAVLAVAASTVVLASPPAQPDSLVGAAESSPSPVATASASAPAPVAEPTSVPVETLQPEPTPEPSPVAESPAAPAPEAEPERKPTYPPSGTQIIEITADGRPDRPKVGQEWVLDVTVTGSADRPFLQDACYDGGQCAKVAVACAPREANYSPPPPRPGKVQRTFRHTFTTPGRHEVQLEADSGCSYYIGADELVLVVQVDEQPPPASPSPSPSAVASPAQ